MSYQERYQRWINKGTHREEKNAYMREYSSRTNRIAQKKWKKNNPEKFKLMRKVCKYKRKKSGILTIEIIQQVYEYNIKQYGTLTCELCLKPIEFGKDSIDHKIPLSRGGNHNFENLCISHLTCNLRKNSLTIEEWFDRQRSLNVNAGAVKDESKI